MILLKWNHITVFPSSKPSNGFLHQLEQISYRPYKQWRAGRCLTVGSRGGERWLGAFANCSVPSPSKANVKPPTWHHGATSAPEPVWVGSSTLLHRGPLCRNWPQTTSPEELLILLPLFPLLGPWSSCYFLNVASMFLPQGLCTYASLCLGCSSPRSVHDLLDFIQFSAQMLLRDLPWTTYLIYMNPRPPSLLLPYSALCFSKGTNP